MRGARAWVLGAVLLVALVAVVFATQQNGSSPDHNSNSDNADGTSALRLFAQAMGHPTDQVEGRFSPPLPQDMMFVFTPTNPFTHDEAATTLSWLRGGGVLVYAGESGDPELDGALGVRRANALVTSSTATASGPLFGGVNQVRGGPLAIPFELTSNQVAVLRAGPYALAYLERIGSGTAVVLADPLELANGYLDKASNGRFAADLLALVPAGARVTFDEYHHGLVAADFAPQAWVLTPWGASLLWLMVAVFAGLLLRGRRFGPLVPREAEALRAEAEWAVAVGGLLRRSGARAVTLGVLATASEREVASHMGLSPQPRERFWHALWQRAPEVAQELDSAERALYGSSSSEKDLLSAAQRLHRVAYPVSERQRRRT
jgi:uncharacterized protein DUF4350